MSQSTNRKECQIDLRWDGGFVQCSLEDWQLVHWGEGSKLVLCTQDGRWSVIWTWLGCSTTWVGHCKMRFKTSWESSTYATTRAMSVLPVPGGPNSKILRGGLMPIDLNSCGWCRGSFTSSQICAICLRHPPMSSYLTSAKFVSSSSLLTGSPSIWNQCMIISLQFRRPTSVNHCISSHSTELRWICLDDLAFNCLHASADEQGVVFANGEVC